MELAQTPGDHQAAALLEGGGRGVPDPLQPPQLLGLHLVGEAETVSAVPVHDCLLGEGVQCPGRSSHQAQLDVVLVLGDVLTGGRRRPVHEDWCWCPSHKNFEN